MSHKGLIEFWCDGYQAKVGAKYPFQRGKDAAAIKWLLETYTEDEVQAYMRAFFEIRDPFIAKAGYSLGVFRACLPKVQQYAQRVTPVWTPCGKCLGGFVTNPDTGLKRRCPCVPRRVSEKG